MATGTLTNRLLDPSGTALSGVTVTAYLKPGPTGFRAGTFSEISQLESTTTDASGDWSLTLEVNTDILPGDSYWEVVEQVPTASGTPTTWAVQVAAGSHTLYASLVSTPPAVSVPSYITQSSGDARYLQTSGGVGLGSIQAVGTATATGTATSAAAANHVHPLSPAVIGSGLSLSAGVVSVANLTNSNATSGLLFTQTTTATATVGLSQGQFVYNSASAAVFLFNGAARVCITPQTAVVDTTETTTNTSYVNLATVGPSVTILTGTRAQVTVGASVFNTGANGYNFVAAAVSGATTQAAADALGAFCNDTETGQERTLTRVAMLTGLTPGLNTFTLQYRVLTGTGSFKYRSLTVVGLP